MIFNKIKWAPFALTLFTIPLVSSCSSNDEEEQQEVKRPISVVVSENPMIEEESGSRITRTEAPTTTGTLTEFKMMYQADAEIKTEYTAEKTGSPANWGLTPSHWPTVGNTEKINFYAYNGGTFNYNNGTPYVAFETEGSAFSQKDYLVATHKNISYNDKQGVVSLSFDHACAAVEFNICQTQKISSHTIVVKSVVLKNVKKKGDYSYEYGWSLGGETTNYTLIDGDITLETNPTYKRLPCKWLFLIPQPKSDIKLDISYTIDGTADFREISIGTDSWEAGNQYTINIKVGSSFLPQQQS